MAFGRDLSLVCHATPGSVLAPHRPLIPPSPQKNTIRSSKRLHHVTSDLALLHLRSVDPFYSSYAVPSFLSFIANSVIPFMVPVLGGR